MVEMMRTRMTTDDDREDTEGNGEVQNEYDDEGHC